MKTKNLIILLGMIFLIGIVSAISWTFWNGKIYKDETSNNINMFPVIFYGHWTIFFGGGLWNFL
jgi:uncharacterized membrane protein